MTKLRTTEDLVVLVQGGGSLLEHRHANVEIKSSWEKKYGVDLCALGNKIEEPICFCVVGIDDQGTVLGQDEKWARETEKTLSQQLNQFLDPIQACKSITCHDTGRGWIVVVSLVNPGAVVKWESVAYKASGTTSSKMLPEEVMELTMRLPGLTDRTAQPWTGTLDEALAKGYLGRVPGFDTNLSTGEDIARNLGRLGIHGKEAAHILFGECSYRVVFYDAQEKPAGNHVRRGLFSLLLGDSFIDEVQTWTKTQLVANDDPYSKTALKEALANAIAHAAYTERDGDLILEVYHDRIVISNLSFPAASYFANKWFSRHHNTVNRLLMESLRLAGFVDEVGRGKGLIFSESIKGGKRPPQVFLEGAGQYNRWRLVLHGGSKDKRVLRLLERLRTHYNDDNKAQIATALVLWSGQPVGDIRKYIDGESLSAFVEVLQDLRGPVFYYEKEDRLYLRRWATVVMGEGQDSKSLTLPEEENLLRFARDFCGKFHRDYITPAQLRDLAGMGNTRSEQTLASTLLSKWLTDGEVERVRHGTYRFKARQIPFVNLADVLAGRLAKPKEEPAP